MRARVYTIPDYKFCIINSRSSRQPAAACSGGFFSFTVDIILGTFEEATNTLSERSFPSWLYTLVGKQIREIAKRRHRALRFYSLKTRARARPARI